MPVPTLGRTHQCAVGRNWVLQFGGGARCVETPLLADSPLRPGAGTGSEIRHQPLKLGMVSQELAARGDQSVDLFVGQREAGRNLVEELPLLGVLDTLEVQQDEVGLY